MSPPERKLHALSFKSAGRDVQQVTRRPAGADQRRGRPDQTGLQPLRLRTRSAPDCSRAVARHLQVHQRGRSRAGRTGRPDRPATQPRPSGATVTDPGSRQHLGARRNLRPLRRCAGSSVHRKSPADGRGAGGAELRPSGFRRTRPHQEAADLSASGVEASTDTGDGNTRRHLRRRLLPESDSSASETAAEESNSPGSSRHPMATCCATA